jgi:hypothetical protein
LLQDRDEELAHAFNDPRRSRMIVQLAAIHAYGLLESEEFARFTAGTRGHRRGACEGGWAVMCGSPSNKPMHLTGALV